MRRAYILVYSSTLGSRRQVKNWLEEIPEVLLWRYDMPNCCYIVSDASAQQLSNALRTKSGGKGRFLITEVSPNKQGWLPPETWYMFRHKQFKPRL